MTIIPPYLSPGDTMLVIATARKTSKPELEPVIDKIKSWGLKVEFGRNLFGEDNQFSGTDKERTEDLQWALDHPYAKAIINARGGYGTLRIIDNIDFSAFTKNPKWMVGFSDVTILHSHLYRLGFCSLHGTMPNNFFNNETATDSIKKLLFNEPVIYNIPDHPFNRHGLAHGDLIGGNLSLLFALSGSRSEMDYENKVLFLEDLDEYLYHIDRMMLQLKRSGKLQNLAGLIIGGMSGMRDNTVPFGRNAEQIIKDCVAEFEYPVCFNFPAGHIPVNMAFYHGRKINLHVSAQGQSLTFL
jgi:muramoyltetrapeptide carboxypeptidase